MIQLRARLTEVSLQRKLQRLVYRIGDDVNNMGCFELTSLDCNQPKMVLIHDDGRPISGLECDYVVVPTAMNYLKPGDIVSLSADGKTLNTLWRGNGTTNTLLLTERCDNYCLMCSQPPREREDGYLLEQAFDVISLMPKDAHEIGFSGGEPTLYGDSFVDLVRHVRDELPETSLHILSNGRRFADPIFSAKYAHATSAGTMVGIPIYGAEFSLHDHVVQANGAFEETIRGILNLGELGQAIEIRVVLHAQTAPHIVEIADYIARNLPFVDQVALMGMEMMGLARRNIGQLWIEPYKYSEDLAEATELLNAHRIHTMIYNHQLCVLHRDIWDFAVKSISDWKNEYDPICADCDVLERCGGFFHSAKYGSSDQVTPLNSDGSPKNNRKSQIETSKPTSAWSRRRIPITPISN